MTAAELFNICEQFKSEHGVDDTLTVLGSIFDTIAYANGIEVSDEDDDTLDEMGGGYRLQ